MNASLRQAIEGVRVLWPHLQPLERINWCWILMGQLGFNDWWEVIPLVRDESVDLTAATYEGKKLP